MVLAVVRVSWVQCGGGRGSHGGLLRGRVRGALPAEVEAEWEGGGGGAEAGAILLRVEKGVGLEVRIAHVGG